MGGEDALQNFAVAQPAFRCSFRDRMLKQSMTSNRPWVQLLFGKGLARSSLAGLRKSTQDPSKSVTSTKLIRLTQEHLENLRDQDKSPKYQIKTSLS